MILTKLIATKVFNLEEEEGRRRGWNQFQISSELFPIPRSGRVKESDNFAGYNFTRSKERERVSATRINIAICTQRGDTIHRERKRDRSTPADWYLANVYVLASAYIISRHSWRACCA